MKIEVRDQKFTDFRPKVESSGCFLEIEGRLLLVQQAPGQPSEGCWAVPAGRLEVNETPEITAKRELWEETGIELPSLSSLVYLKTLYSRFPNGDAVYHMFKVQLEEKPSIRLSFEHSGYKWALPEECSRLPLRPGIKEALEYYYEILRSSPDPVI